ncbi:MAG: UDP-N-acetylmuramate dehydrogenase [Cyclobacteriaceae bacterium]|nr:UDP-N-acetylmuramate dehydrogenase [Cyclobacteriaceae bacterium]
MTIQEHVSLQPYNTFGIDANARYFVEIRTEEELVALCKGDFLKDKNLLILGGGSNMLFTQDFDGIVIKNSIQGFDTKHAGETIYVTAGAGMVWHELVLKTLENGINGLENLSLIPGTVGAAPVQNIGAYGVELKDLFFELKAIEIDSGEVKTFLHEECAFDYRYSVFKGPLKGKYIISSVTLKLHTSIEVNTSYGAINSTLNEWNIANPTPKEVSDAVIHIRQSKLPDPAKVGNAGSFFKNPVITKKQYDLLKSEFETIPGYPQPNNRVKVPAAWLIDQNGWKGKTLGNIGVNPKQPLVLVNYGGGKGAELKELAYSILDSVKERFGIELEPEVNII